jgi:hypothetical protein
MQGRRDISTFVESFTGSHIYVAEYLVEEVLQRKPEDVQAFLLQTSILERLNAELCNAVTGRQDGQGVLVALNRANLFVLPLDDEGQWYRYHRLFSDLLQARLRQTSPADAITTLHQRAAAWYEQAGMTPQAIEHALAATDYSHASQLIEKIAQPVDEKVAVWLDICPMCQVRHEVLSLGRKRKRAWFAAFGAIDVPFPVQGYHPVLQVDILHPQPGGFADTQPCGPYQPEQPGHDRIQRGDVGNNRLGLLLGVGDRLRFRVETARAALLFVGQQRRSIRREDAGLAARSIQLADRGAHPGDPPAGALPLLQLLDIGQRHLGLDLG